MFFKTGSSEILYVDHAGQELTDVHLLGLKACTTHGSSNVSVNRLNLKSAESVFHGFSFLTMKSRQLRSQAQIVGIDNKTKTINRLLQFGYKYIYPPILFFF